MHVRLLLTLSTVALLSLGSCKADKKKHTSTDAPIKELKKDGEKLRADTDELLRRRGTLQRSRAELEEARRKLEAKRAHLAKDDIAGHAALAKEEAALRSKEVALKSQEQKINDRLLAALRRQEQFYSRATAALEARAGGSGDSTEAVRQREHAVALREKAVAQRERALAKRERALNEEYRKVVEYKAKKCAVATPIVTAIAAPSLPRSVGGRSYSRADAKAAFAKAMATMSGKGIRVSDLPSGFAKLIGDIRRFIRHKEYARAKFASDQLRATLRSIKIGRAFVGAKMGRLAALIRRKHLSEKKRKAVSALFVKVTTAYNDGRFRTANARINQIYHTIR